MHKQLNLPPYVNYLVVLFEHNGHHHELYTEQTCMLKQAHLVVDGSDKFFILHRSGSLADSEAVTWDEIDDTLAHLEQTGELKTTLIA